MVFFLKKHVNLFSIYVLRLIFVYVVARQLLLKLFFDDILRMISHIDFKYGSINFRLERKQPAKYQDRGIAPLVPIYFIHILSFVEESSCLLTWPIILAMLQRITEKCEYLYYEISKLSESSLILLLRVY